MKAIYSLRLFVIVLSASVFVFAAQYGGQAAMRKVLDTTHGFADGTVLGNVNVSGKIEEEAQVLLQKRVDIWKREARLQFFYEDTGLMLPSSLFIFDIVDSVQGARDGRHSPLEVILQEEQLRSFLSEHIGDQLLKQMNIEKLQEQLLQAASMLSREKTWHLADVIGQDATKTVVSQNAIAGISSYYGGLQEWMARYETLTIPAKGEISLEKIVQKGALAIDNGTLSVIASLMYKTVLPTNFQVKERSISMELPQYAELGTEARFAKGKADFVIYNPNEFPYTLRFVLEGDTFTLSVEGMPFVHSYMVKRNEISDIPARTVVQPFLSSQSKHDAVTPPHAGKKGYVVKVYREQYRSNGTFVKRELMAEDYYLQSNEVIHVDVVSWPEQSSPEMPAPQTKNGQ
ncbi:MAG: hypothetical protein ACE3JN_16355 [Ectobacillus sp.]